MQPAGVRENASPESSAGSHRERVAALYDEHAASVYHYLLAMLGSHAQAEDALQSVFLELVRRPGTLDGIQSPRTYLLTMARHHAARTRRSTQRRSSVEEEAGRSRLLEATATAQVDPEEAARLQQAILALPDEQREVLVLKAFEGLSHREIGLVLGVPENTVASRYRYALEKLRQQLSGKLEP